MLRSSYYWRAKEISELITKSHEVKLMQVQMREVDVLEIQRSKEVAYEVGTHTHLHASKSTHI